MGKTKSLPLSLLYCLYGTWHHVPICFSVFRKSAAEGRNGALVDYSCLSGSADGARISYGSQGVPPIASLIVLSLIELHIRSFKFTGEEWPKTLFMLLGAMFVFSSVYYPHIKSSWGGGSPVPVVIYLSKESPVRPNQQVSAELVDESDAGFYILGHGEK